MIDTSYENNNLNKKIKNNGHIAYLKESRFRQPKRNVDNTNKLFSESYNQELIINYSHNNSLQSIFERRSSRIKKKKVDNKSKYSSS